MECVYFSEGRVRPTDWQTRMAQQCLWKRLLKFWLLRQTLQGNLCEDVISVVQCNLFAPFTIVATNEQNEPIEIALFSLKIQDLQSLLTRHRRYQFCVEGVQLTLLFSGKSTTLSFRKIQSNVKVVTETTVPIDCSCYTWHLCTYLMMISAKYSARITIGGAF